MYMDGQRDWTYIEFKESQHTVIDKKFPEMRDDQFHGMLHNTCFTLYLHYSVIGQSTQRQILCNP
jgi:hypothetical protein